MGQRGSRYKNPEHVSSSDHLMMLNLKTLMRFIKKKGFLPGEKEGMALRPSPVFNFLSEVKLLSNNEFAGIYCSSITHLQYISTRL